MYRADTLGPLQFFSTCNFEFILDPPKMNFKTFNNIDLGKFKQLDYFSAVEVKVCMKSKTLLFFLRLFIKSNHTA